MSFDNWNEIRTAFHVARVGTVSGAADALGVHHATVIRHIDALEAALGAKLFQRHARGYSPTEAGHDLFRVAQTTDEQFAQLTARLQGQGAQVTGELVVTALAGFARWLVPALTALQQAHPGLVVRLLTDERLFRLEFGEAHVAIRAGAAPEDPDNVVQPFVTARQALFASPAYLERMGRPETDADLAGHQFVTHDDDHSRAAFFRWLQSVLPREVQSFRATDSTSRAAAIEAGAGLGFLSQFEAPYYPDLVEVMPPRPEWEAGTWLVTHVDLHRTAKVQASLSALKAAAASIG